MQSGERMPHVPGLLTHREEHLEGWFLPRLQITGLILKEHVTSINLKPKLALSPVTSPSDTRGRTENNKNNKKEKKFSAASSSLAFQGDSREIMQYLQKGNLISSLRQTHPHPINNQPRSRWEESGVGTPPEGQHWACVRRSGTLQDRSRSFWAENLFSQTHLHCKQRCIHIKVFILLLSISRYKCLNQPSDEPHLHSSYS